MIREWMRSAASAVPMQVAPQVLSADVVLALSILFACVEPCTLAQAFLNFTAYSSKRLHLSLGAGRPVLQCPATRSSWACSCSNVDPFLVILALLTCLSCTGGGRFLQRHAQRFIRAGRACSALAAYASFDLAPQMQKLLLHRHSALDSAASCRATFLSRAPSHVARCRRGRCGSTKRSTARCTATPQS